MSRYIGSACRLCRRENMKLFLKGDRCFSDKCAFDRRGYAPGEHGQRRGRKISDYGVQLREKQKVKRMYGLSEKQFRLTFEEADRLKGISGSNLLMLLERRLDNVVYRMGFANSRNQARHFTQHGHFLVNGRRVDIPSYKVKTGDIIEPSEKSRKMQFVMDAMEAVVRRGLPQWMDLDKTAIKGQIKSMPNREDLTMPMQEHLIIELYSR